MLTVVLVTISNLASIMSNGVTHRFGVISSFNGVLSPVTSGMARNYLVVYLAAGFGLVVPLVLLFMIGRNVVFFVNCLICGQGSSIGDSG